MAASTSVPTSSLASSSLASSSNIIASGTTVSLSTLSPSIILVDVPSPSPILVSCVDPSPAASSSSTPTPSSETYLCGMEGSMKEDLVDFDAFYSYGYYQCIINCKSRPDYATSCMATIPATLTRKDFLPVTENPGTPN